jgi:hypothetical protein
MGLLLGFAFDMMAYRVKYPSSDENFWVISSQVWVELLQIFHSMICLEGSPKKSTRDKVLHMRRWGIPCTEFAISPKTGPEFMVSCWGVVIPQSPRIYILYDFIISSGIQPVKRICIGWMTITYHSPFISWNLTMEPWSFSTWNGWPFGSTGRESSRATDGWQTHRSSARPRALWQREESQKSPVMVVTLGLQFHEFLWVRFHPMEVRIPYL